jgi:hypothetical protein
MAAVTSPLIGADTCSQLVTTIRVLLAKTFEVPLRVREILHGSLTTVSRRIDFTENYDNRWRGTALSRAWPGRWYPRPHWSRDPGVKEPGCLETP